MTCSSGKRSFRTIHAVGLAARRLAITLNQQGQIVEDSFAYTCPECKHLHLTRRPAWDGKPNTLVHPAAPESLQRWAMGQT